MFSNRTSPHPPSPPPRRQSCLKRMSLLALSSPSSTKSSSLSTGMKTWRVSRQPRRSTSFWPMKGASSRVSKSPHSDSPRPPSPLPSSSYDPRSSHARGGSMFFRNKKPQLFARQYFFQVAKLVFRGRSASKWQNYLLAVKAKTLSFNPTARKYSFNSLVASNIDIQTLF